MAETLLSAVKPIVQGVVSWNTWYATETRRASKVALARDYADGEHRSSLTKEMRAMLRIDKAEIGSPFNLNHMDNIIQMVVDRLDLTGIRADNEEASAWFGAAMRDNRLDGLQLDVHEAAVRDGDGYVMVSYDEGGLKLTLEDAFDGETGVIMVYEADKRTPKLALKVWRETMPAVGKEAAKLMTRVNAYYPDRVEKYFSPEGATGLLPYIKDGEEAVQAWMFNGEPLGIPITHFRNRSAKNRAGGKSEINDAIPVQDSINRILVSMVMASELTAFMIRWAIGINPPTALTPGMFIKAFPKDANGGLKIPTENEKAWLDSIRFGNLEQGELMPFIEQAKFEIDQMYTITRTPKIGDNDSASGESLKQKEIGLVGKVRRAQVSFGNAWENVARMMWRVESAYGGTNPPAYERVEAQWRSPELRNDTSVVDNVLKVADRLDERTVLELLSPVFGWDSGKIDLIMEAKRGDAGSRLADIARNVPGMDQFSGLALAG